ncbi:MAG: NAD(P)-dependent oxidoreductase [Gammaproteobacteria bacterium]|nr:NAD(P)-dependent oxidoreductase [Gammaproteobacteria bacterium]
MKIGLLGTGLLGSAVVERLLDQGFAVTVWNRTADKTAPLAALGAQQATTAAEAIAASEVILLFLADRAACEGVLLAPPTRTALPGKTVVQMGTLGPEDSRQLAQALTTAGAEYAECPVLGSLPEARAGTLILMYGGDEDLLKRIEPMLRALGPEPKRIGEVGQAAALKLALNQLIAAETAAFAMSLALVQASGVAVEDFMQILRGSALYAPTFDKKLKRMLKHDYAHPNFPLDHLIKDVHLFIRAAEGAGIDTSPLAALETVLGKVSVQGHGNADYSVLAEGFRPM